MLTGTARANNPCAPIIQACDSAIAAQGKQIKDLKLGLANSQNDVRLLDTKVQERDAQLSAFYRNPWIMMGIGLIGGLVLFRR